MKTLNEAICDLDLNFSNNLIGDLLEISDEDSTVRIDDNYQIKVIEDNSYRVEEELDLLSEGDIFISFDNYKNYKDDKDLSKYKSFKYTSYGFSQSDSLEVTVFYLGYLDKEKLKKEINTYLWDMPYTLSLEYSFLSPNGNKYWEIVTNDGLPEIEYGHYNLEN